MAAKPSKLVKIHDVNIDKDYICWIEELKSRYRRAQIKAAFPESKGFSTTNLWRMKQWYQFYSDALKKLPQLVGEFQLSESQSNTKLAHLVGEFEDTDFPPLFACVPWGHHSEIIAKCKTIKEAIFYVKKSATEGWSRNTLMNCIRARLYDNFGGAITNFSDRLPSPQSELAQAITKDTYDFGFISLEDGYKEEALETELEKQLIIAGKTRKLDMLFFHIPLNCYIVIELKAVPFQPEFAGKLNFYVNAVGDLIKTPSQNPTIGLLICSNKEETEVQYAFNGITTPMGVASYDNVKVKEIQDQLPSVEELTKRIRLLEEQLNKKQE